MKLLKKIFPAFLLSLLTLSSFASNQRESTICGFFQERFLFWIWSSAAPSPDESRVKHLKYVKNVTFMTSDNKKLSGYVYLAHDKQKNKTRAKGYILMALGNAMISDQMIAEMKKFAQKGYDVYIYDYRGYGNSQGKRRINAIIKDYKEIVTSLNQKYDRHMLYGISLGAAIIMNAIGGGVHYDAAVIDSSPSRFSLYGCPQRIDPIDNLPANASKIFVITGQKDTVLKPNMTSSFRRAAQIKNAKVFDGSDYAHPFMDKSAVVHQKRMEMVLDFLSGESKEIK